MTRPRQLLFTLLLLAFPGSVFALGFRIADQDPFATARGDAFAATADRPSAIYYNPAGIAMLDGQRFHLGVYGIEIQVEMNPAGGGQTIKNKHQIQVVPQLFYTGHVENTPFTFGLGIYSPFGFGLEYPEDSAIRELAIKGRIRFLTLNPVFAWKICDSLSIAFGPTINIADTKLSRGIPGAGNTFQFEGSGVGYGFNAGILWQPHRMHSFGLVYRSATDIQFSGQTETHLSDDTRRAIRQANQQIRTANAAIQNIKKTVGPFGPAAVNATLAAFGLPSEEIPELQTSFPNEDADAKIHFPQSIVFGYSFRPTPAWNFEFNLDWTDWDSLNSVTLHQQKSPNIDLPFNYQSSFFYEFGATHFFKNGMNVSLGYIYSENSVPNEFFNPIVPDSNRHIFTAGIGYRGERLNCDLAYQLAYGPSRDIHNGTAADGTYDYLSHALSLSIGYQF